MYQVTFRFENQEQVRVFAAPDATLLEAARDANVAIDAPCGGNGSCGKCRVQLLEGELESPRTAHISEEDYAAGWRLSCASRITSDVVVLVPDIASAYKSRMKTADLSTGAEIAIFERLQADIRAAGIGFGNNFASYLVEMTPPTLDDTMPDVERMILAVKAAAGCEEAALAFNVVQKLSKVLRESDFRVRVLGVHKFGWFRVYEVLPADDPTPLCGCAIDIGTTTVSAVLADLKTGRLLAKASAGNGQIRYGADVINRIIEQSKPGGYKRLQDAIVRETLTPLIETMCQSAHIRPKRILRFCIASNTTMNHLLLAVDASPVRMEPYIPTFFRWSGLKAPDIGLPGNHSASVILTPNIGSYVGGDITAGAFASLLWNREEYSLFIDLGTNGEIVFGNRDFMMACACSAGPAFEGGDISCGMRATDGAVEAVRIDRGTLEPEVRVVGAPGQKPVGLCGSGIIDVIAELYRVSAISPKGEFTREGLRILTDRHGMKRYVLAFPDESDTGREVSITEVDIGSFIRAKGAIFSAISILLSSLDMDVSVLEHIFVAGGIGSGINMENAVRIGMFPDVEREKFTYIGNSSLAGAYAAVVSDEAREKIYALAANMTYMELSTNPRYMDEFVAACFLPHTNRELFPSSVQE
mgnify:CR=1 FL=1